MPQTRLQMAGRKGICNVAGMRYRRKGGRKRIGESAHLLSGPEQELIRLQQLWLSRLEIIGYTESSRNTYQWGLEPYLKWTQSQTIENPLCVTRELLEHYQGWLFVCRKADGGQLSFSTQRARIMSIKIFFKWLFEQGHIETNPASELRLPKAPYRSLPKTLSRSEITRLLLLPSIHDPLGLRDRTMLELFYATGIRRMELVKLGSVLN